MDSFALLATIRDRLRADLPDLPVQPQVEPRGLRRTLRRRFDLRSARPLPELVTEVVELLRRYNAHGIHPRSFGAFHPPVREAGVIGETLAALFNPQLATWYQAPVAVEIEAYVLRFLAARLGLPGAGQATFTSGGLEANLSALCAALGRLAPAWAEQGLRALAGAPVLYLSAEGHHSFEKVARITGLGTAAVRRVAVDERARLSLPHLQEMVSADRVAGRLPFLVVATAGTTVSGAVDPLAALGAFCRRESLWFHVDAAWGGTAAFSPVLRPLLHGIEGADSVTWDAHKGLWAPHSAGMFFCADGAALRAAFSVRAGRYVPRSPDTVEDPYASSFGWGRRFRGLKVFLTLAELGEHGVSERVELQRLRGAQVRERLTAAGFEVVNDTPLPLVCFRHPALGPRGEGVPRFLRRVQARGRVWLSPVGLTDGTRAVRCCITSPETTEDDLHVLMEELHASLPA